MAYCIYIGGGGAGEACLVLGGGGVSHFYMQCLFLCERPSD